MVLVRHGESEWNLENKFTGWSDIKLTKKGKMDSKNVGKLLKRKRLFFDLALSSYLKRAIHSLWNILLELDQHWIPVKKSWRLNERHYGRLQGLNKKKLCKKYGEENIRILRRSFLEVPPKVKFDDFRYPGNDIKYKNIDKKLLPFSESLKDTLLRVLPFLKNKVIKNIKNKKNLLIVAHGNSIRAIIKYIEKINDKEIENIEIETSRPLIYYFKGSDISEKYYL